MQTMVEAVKNEVVAAVFEIEINEMRLIKLKTKHTCICTLSEQTFHSDNFVNFFLTVKLIFFFYS